MQLWRMTMILHCSDLHLRHFDWLSVNAPKFDLTVISGDLLSQSPREKLTMAAQVRMTSAWLASLRGTIALCGGNHDYVEAWDESIDPSDAEGGWLQKARRKSVMVDGDVRMLHEFRVVCRPWIGGPAFVEKGGPTILVTHCGAEGSGVVCADEPWAAGDFEVMQILPTLARGSFCLSGHIHDPDSWYGVVEGAGVQCFNPGVTEAAGAAFPNHIIIDTVARRAELHRWRQPKEAIRI
jgi:predicted phosphodiesterase